MRRLRCYRLEREMLLFAEPPIASDGKPIWPGLAAFPDHARSDIVYYLPDNVHLMLSSNGEPDFFLLRYHGDFAKAEGGLLRFRLGFSPPLEAERLKAAAAGWQLRQVGFDGARFRLRVNSLEQDEAEQLGQWRVLVAGNELVAPAVTLDARETQFLERLLEDAFSPIEVSLDLRYSGIIAGIPWFVSANTSRLKTLLSPLLPASPATAAQITAAFLSLPQDADLFTFRALSPGAVMPAGDVMLPEVAARSLEHLFVQQPRADSFAVPTYVLRGVSAEPTTVSWDLLPSRQESRAAIMTWALGSLIQNLATAEQRRKLFPAVDEFSPFTEADIHIINRVPFDSNFLCKVVVDVRYSGPAGVPEVRTFTFDGKTELQSFSTFHPAATGLQLAYRMTTTVASPAGGWPVVRKGEYVFANEPIVEVSRKTLGMDFVQVDCEPEVFVKAASIDISISAEPFHEPVNMRLLAQFSLTSARPTASVALAGIHPDAELYARAVAHGFGSPEPTPVILRSDRVVDRSLRIAEYQLEILEPDRISIELDPEVASSYAVVRVILAELGGESRTYTLGSQQPLVWNFFRETVFDALRYKYRLEYVPLDSQGRTLPMVSTDWVITEQSALILRPSLDTQEVRA